MIVYLYIDSSLKTPPWGERNTTFSFKGYVENHCICYAEKQITESGTLSTSLYLSNIANIYTLENKQGKQRDVIINCN